MARSVTDIQTQIQSYLVANFAAIGVAIDTTKWSRRNIMRLFCFTYATMAAYYEQLIDTVKAEIEANILISVSASILWIQTKMFEFQYSATIPQIIQIVAGVPAYPTIDETLRIITACSVSSSSPNAVLIKVAKGTTLTALTAPELTSAQGYIDLLGTAGIQYVVQSNASDKIYVEAEIFYNKQYASIISNSVILAINNLFLTLSTENFNGSLKMSDLEGTIRNVEGVNDVILMNVKGRGDSTPFGSAVDLILGNDVLIRQWNTISGYCVAETTAGSTLADKLIFTAE